MRSRVIIFPALALLLAAAVLPAAADIIEAAKKGDLEVVKAILAADPGKIDVVCERGMPPLYWAGILARWEVYEFLLEHGPDLGPMGVVKETPLHGVCHHDRPDMVKLLLEAGVDPNVRDLWGTTALHIAVWRGCPKAAEVLIDGGIDTSLASNEGWTALHCANLSGHKECVELLLRRGLPTDVVDDKGRTPAELWRERPEPVEIAGRGLEDYTGSYFEGYLPVWLDGGKLYLADYAVEELYPIGEDTFFCRQAPWKIVFLRDAEGKVESIELHFLRRTLTGRKTE
ncbi:MAG TPA: ankyrin repeat domain-containing protein [Acidobacteriota bacterium]|nr:ankyrin repeat domain-containing protein [Acidobacteriota bacterium]